MSDDPTSRIDDDPWIGWPGLSADGEPPVVDDELRASGLADLQQIVGEEPQIVAETMTKNPIFGAVWRADHLDPERVSDGLPHARFVAWRRPDGRLMTTIGVEDYPVQEGAPPDLLKELPPLAPVEGETPVDDPDLVRESLAFQPHMQIMGATVTRNDRWGVIFRYDWYEFEEHKKDLWSRHVVCRMPSGKIHLLSCCSIDAGDPLPEHEFVRELTRDRPKNEHPPLAPDASETPISDPVFAEECRVNHLPPGNVIASITTHGERFGKVYRADYHHSEFDRDHPMRCVVWHAPDGDWRQFFSDASEAGPLPSSAASRYPGKHGE
jgi:hypothetical protein